MRSPGSQYRFAGTRSGSLDDHFPPKLGSFDQAVPAGVPGIRPYFETLTLEIVVYTDETQERLEKLAKNVEFRCPVMNLFVAADVTMDVSLTKRPAAEYRGDVE